MRIEAVTNLGLALMDKNPDIKTKLRMQELARRREQRKREARADRMTLDGKR